MPIRTSLLLSLAAVSFAQTPLPAGLREINDFLNLRASEITARAESETRASSTWEPRRAQREIELRDMLGLLPWPRRAALNARITGRIDAGSCIIEKIAFESLPKVYVTANLYLPMTRTGKVPAIVYVCGHALSNYGAKTQYQRHGISFAKNGYVALIVDPIQSAETFALHHGVASQEMYDWYSRGYSPGGVETWNAIRALDYLETRPEVDATRIGMTGRSGGAAVSWYTAALDARVKVVSPVMGISTYAANLPANTQRLHCDCMFPINFHLHDMMHQAALIAPRPLLMAHGHKDDLFPVPGYTAVEQTMSALYASYGKGEQFRNLVVETAHADSDFLREEVLRWFDRYLRGTPDRTLDMAYKNAPDADLAVFPDGPPPDARNMNLHESFIPPPPAPTVTTRTSWEARSRLLLEQLRTRVFDHLPSVPVDIAIERNLPKPAPSSWEDVRISAPGFLAMRALFRKPSKATGKLPALLFIASEGDTIRTLDLFLASVGRRNDSVRLIVFPAGVSELPWDRDTWRDVMRNSMHVGLTVDAIRLAQVKLALAALPRMDEAVDASRILVAGRGVSGVIGLYAAILEPSVHQVMLADPPVSHRTGPTFLNILRYTDLPEAAGLLAPRQLNFFSRIPAEYDLTRKIYTLNGKPSGVFRTLDVGALLNDRYDHNFASRGE